MDKSKILEAIHRIAVANRGKAPGRQAFESQTGIKMSDWYPHHWLRWGDALVEAGYTPNQLQRATSDDALIESYIALVRELQHLPVEGEIRRKASADKSFPSHSVFGRFGGKGKLLDAILKYCQEHPGYEDVIALLKNRKPSPNDETDTSPRRKSKLVTGFVYLMKSGRHYKIGHTVSVGSRERQLAVKIPIHYEPGKKFQYASSETQVLGLVLRQAIGKSLTDYLSEKIWQPMGAESDASWTIDKSGQEAAFCCLGATLRDFGRLGMLLANDGVASGKQIVPQEWVREATQPTSDYPHLKPGVARPYFGYGYQFWVFPGSKRRFALLGVRGQAIFIDPELKLVMVQTAVWKSPTHPESWRERDAFWNGIVQTYRSW